MTKQQRKQNLLPRGIPKYVRCYDSGEGGERYTVCFTGRAGVSRSPGTTPEYCYRGMSEYPFHPQGVGQWGSMKGRHCDVNKWGFAPALGKKCHLGRRIPFKNLPPDCRKLVLRDYKEIWQLQ